MSIVFNVLKSNVQVNFSFYFSVLLGIWAFISLSKMNINFVHTFNSFSETMSIIYVVTAAFLISGLLTIGTLIMLSILFRK